MSESAETLVKITRRVDCPRAIVAIPVCNEERRIGACLEALARQVGLDPGGLGIVLFLNNCTDGTSDVVRTFTDMPWQIRVIERMDAAASAGWARRIVMDAAADWLTEAGSDGILLTTDADTRVPLDWVALNLAAIARGAHAVAGCIALDPVEAALLPASLHARGRLEGQYGALLTEIGAFIDPEPGNVWPCHCSKSGATLAARLSTYRDVGGMPDMPKGEDRAFVDAIVSRDLIVRYAPEIEVITSGRLDGRASGGVADTMKLRCEVPDSPCDDRLERLDRSMARILWRRRIRRLHAEKRLSSVWLWAPLLSIPKQTAEQIARVPFFGQAYAMIERASPRLTYRPVRPSQLASQIRVARLMVGFLRAWTTNSRAERPACSRSFETETVPVRTQPLTP